MTGKWVGKALKRIGIVPGSKKRGASNTPQIASQQPLFPEKPATPDETPNTDVAVNKRRILVIDDDEDLVSAIKVVLESEMVGYEIDTVYDGAAAVEKWSEQKHYIVILDMMIPKRSGFLVLDRLHVDYRKIPNQIRNNRPIIIMITGNLGSRHKAYAESLGVDDYLQKPFKMERLLLAIKAQIEKRNQQAT